jgi:hypothetical protein
MYSNVKRKFLDQPDESQISLFAGKTRPFRTDSLRNAGGSEGPASG